MADTSSRFAGSIPELYDRCMGPVMFQPYAEDLARRVAERVAGGTVLETACGTGMLTRQLRAALAPDVRLVSTDLNQPMLDETQPMLWVHIASVSVRIGGPGVRQPPCPVGDQARQEPASFPQTDTFAVRLPGDGR